MPYAAQGVAQQSLSAAAAQLTPLLAAQAASPPVEPGKGIDDRYRGLRDYVGSGPGAPIEQTLKAIDALRQQFAKLASPAAGGVPGAAPAVLTGDDPVVLFEPNHLQLLHGTPELRRSYLDDILPGQKLSLRPLAPLADALRETPHPEPLSAACLVPVE